MKRNKQPGVIREQEGFSRAIGVPKDSVPACSSYFSAHGYSLADFRGPVAAGKAGWNSCAAHRDRNSIEWETTPARSKQPTVFVWIGGSQIRPAVRSCFPFPSATLYVDNVVRLTFPLGTINAAFGTNGFAVAGGGFTLTFEAQRFLSLVEQPHRVFSPHGISGFYRLTVPGEYLKKGKPLRLRVELPPSQPGVETFFYVSPRHDALKSDVAILRAEVAQLQADLVTLTRSHETLYAQVYPQLFPKRLPGQLVIAHQDDTQHLHPAQVTVMRDGEIVVTAREATDHLATDGRMILVRSKDNGRTWGKRELMFDLGKADHRSSPITELANGDWVTFDYRVGSKYNKDGVWDWQATMAHGHTLWGAWSRDRGRTWEFTKEPIHVPGAAPYAESERHIIQLPTGRLLLAANYMPSATDSRAKSNAMAWIAIFCSDDHGRSWRVLSKVPENPNIIGECTMLRTRSGKLLLLSRSEAWTGDDWTKKGMLYQSVSLDEGATWSEFKPTALSSMSSPGHLLQLQDGRILCTHASRFYPGSIYATVSHDEGETWDTANTRIIANDIINDDSCYPNSGQMADGTIITVWYANLFGKFFIPVFLWRPEQL